MMAISTAQVLQVQLSVCGAPRMSEMDVARLWSPCIRYFTVAFAPGVITDGSHRRDGRSRIEVVV